MSTRSVIAMKNPDQSVSGIYCHFDGYPRGVGETLLTCYNDEEKIKRLIALGDLSSLGERLEPSPGSGHSFDNPESGVTVAYHRDRGEELHPAVTWSNETEMLENSPDTHCAEYCYLWAGSCWYVGCTRSQKWYRMSDLRSFSGR